MHCVEPADAGAQHHSHARWIDASDGCGGHGPGLPGGKESELGAAIGAAQKERLQGRCGGIGHAA